jgi:hypothetical protein
MKTKYMFMSHYQNAGKCHALMTANISLKDVAKFKYLGTAVANLNCFHKEIKSRLNLENAC